MIRPCRTFLLTKNLTHNKWKGPYLYIYTTPTKMGIPNRSPTTVEVAASKWSLQKSEPRSPSSFWGPKKKILETWLAQPQFLQRGDFPTIFPVYDPLFSTIVILFEVCREPNPPSFVVEKPTKIQKVIKLNGSSGQFPRIGSTGVTIGFPKSGTAASDGKCTRP